MEAIISNVQKEMAEVNFHDFINEGLRDAKNGKLIEFDDAFEELEKRYSANR